MKAKIFIIIGVVIAIPFIAVIGLIVIMSSVIGAVSIGGGSDGSNDSGYLFRDLPFLADYYTCTSDFGSRSNPTGQGIVYHQGIDLVAFKKDGTKAVDIVSVFDCVVVNVTEASSGSGAGNSLEVFDEVTGLYVRYMHMALKPNFNMNDNVKKGDVLGIQGTTGNSTGIHLHFEMHIQDGENKILVNPRDWFDFPKQGEYRQIDNNENKEQEENNEESKRD